MICPFCRKETMDGAPFCTECGTQIPSAAGNSDNNVNMQYTGKYDFQSSAAAGNEAFPSIDSGQIQGPNAGHTGFGNQENNDRNGFGGTENWNGNTWSGSGGDSDIFGQAGFSDNQSEPFSTQPSSFNSNQFGPSPGGDLSWAGGSDPQDHWNRGGLPRPALIAIIVLIVILFLFGGILVADHFGIVRIPFLHTLDSENGNGGVTKPPVQNPDEGTGTTGPGSSSEPQPGSNTPNTPSPSTLGGGTNQGGSDLGTLSISVTDIEPADLSNYHRVSITGIDAAPGVDGTAAVNMISEKEDVWKTPKKNISSSNENAIGLSFKECGVKVIEIKAGNWESAEAYNADSRPIKIYLAIGGYNYPLSLNDLQTPHYIVLSRPFNTSEILLVIDSISNGTTGNVAVTNVTIYSE